MGAWGHKPFENDLAMDWIDSEIALPVVASIKRAINDYLSNTSLTTDDEDEPAAHEIAEAAVALLLSLTGEGEEMPPTPLAITFNVNEEGLWDLACDGIRKLMTDKDWLESWNDPAEKSSLLRGMLNDLEARRDRPKR